MAKKSTRKSRKKAVKRKKTAKKTKKKTSRPSRARASKKRPTSAKKPTSKKKPTSRTSARAAAKSSRKKGAKSTGRARPGAPENFLGLQVQHVDFLTYKADQVKKFYGEVLGFDVDQRDADLSYLTVHTSASSSLGFMPPHPQMAGEQPPPREPTLYFLVKNVDEVYAKLIAKGVAFMGPPQEMPWGDRVITTTDPEGRTVMIASRRGTSS